MEKIASLRAAIVEANPEFVANPDRLKIFVDVGRLVARQTEEPAFEYRYTVRLELEGFTRSPDAIMVPLLLWIRQYQPELFLNFTTGNEAVKFAADILDATSWDVSVAFDLTEAVTLTRRPGGGWDVTHQPEQPLADLLLVDGALPEVPLREVWLHDQLLVAG